MLALGEPASSIFLPSGAAGVDAVSLADLGVTFAVSDGTRAVPFCACLDLINPSTMKLHIAAIHFLNLVPCCVCILIGPRTAVASSRRGYRRGRAHRP